MFSRDVWKYTYRLLKGGGTVTGFLLAENPVPLVWGSLPSILVLVSLGRVLTGTFANPLPQPAPRLWPSQTSVGFRCMLHLQMLHLAFSQASCPSGCMVAFFTAFAQLLHAWPHQPGVHAPAPDASLCGGLGVGIAHRCVLVSLSCGPVAAPIDW